MKRIQTGRCTEEVTQRGVYLRGRGIVEVNAEYVLPEAILKIF